MTDSATPTSVHANGEIHRYRRLAVVGLGYVGLPSAVFFAEAGFLVVGADVRADAVRELSRGRTHLPDLGMDDRVQALVKSGHLKATSDVAAAVKEADAVFIMVPTPLTGDHEPDLSFVRSAGQSVAKGLRRGQLVILESTVYPGVTEGVLLPELETSGLKAGKDFGLAYCPERYNPGDNEHTIERTRRIVGGLTPDNARDAAGLYSAITKAGVVRVADIRTCEAAKIIENTQRDLNIALMNEFALILEHLHLDVHEVLEAAATKWNFVPYRPGPGVGGHCLPKDPYYLVKTAEKAGYHAQIITAGRRINDAMPGHVFDLAHRALQRKGKPMQGARVAVLGLSYKGNIGDTRLSPSIDLTERLKKAGATILTVDPFVSQNEATERFASTMHVGSPAQLGSAIDAFIVMVAHPSFAPLPLDVLAAKAGSTCVLVDGVRLVPPNEAQEAGFDYWGVGAGRHNGRS